MSASLLPDRFVAVGLSCSGTEIFFAKNASVRRPCLLSRCVGEGERGIDPPPGGSASAGTGTTATGSRSTASNTHFVFLLAFAGSAGRQATNRAKQLV